jgi:hypothetical protein
MPGIAAIDDCKGVSAAVGLPPPQAVKNEANKATALAGAGNFGMGTMANPGQWLPSPGARRTSNNLGILSGTYFGST